MSVQILSYSSAIRACALALLLVTLSSVATARRLSRRLQGNTDIGSCDRSSIRRLLGCWCQPLFQPGV